MRTNLSRRRLLVGAGTAAAVPMLTILHARGETPQFKYKLANDNPMTHPVTIRMQQAAERIKKESNGRMEVAVFPNNQLGGDTDMLSQLRTGALEMMTLDGLILSTYVPLTSIYGIGYAFKSYKEVWAAMDGDLGGLIRGAVDKANLYCFETIWNNGFRSISSSTHPIRTPADLKGYKIRVPVSPLWISLFESFGAAPTSINFNEVYSALQTHVVEGQENPLINVETAKLYEVQKYISMTRHMWGGYLMLANGPAWRRLPPDLQKIVARNLNQAGEEQRKDTMPTDDQLTPVLKKQGMIFNYPDPEPFRQVLIKSGFYDKWRAKYGDANWKVLEKYAGKIGT